jgi:hypothetical protein
MGGEKVDIVALSLAVTHGSIAASEVTTPQAALPLIAALTHASSR